MQDNVNSYLFSEYPKVEVLKRNICLITFDDGVKAKNVVFRLKIIPEEKSIFDKMLILNLGS